MNVIYFEYKKPVSLHGMLKERKKKEKGKKVEKPSLPLKFLHIWQARNILLQQDRKGQPVCGL